MRSKMAKGPAEERETGKTLGGEGQQNLYCGKQLRAEGLQNLWFFSRQDSVTISFAPEKLTVLGGVEF